MPRQKPDDGLRLILRTHLPMMQWTSVETGATQAGVPDLEFCHNGSQGWIECKFTRANKLRFSEFQISWHTRRWREGGKSFIAVRRRRSASPRRNAIDELWLYLGSSIQKLQRDGLCATSTTLTWSEGGPSNWDWAEIQKFII